MTNTEIRLEALKAALNINSPCARPYDRVGDLLIDTQNIFEFLKQGTMPKLEEVADQSLQGGS